ncbi:Protein RFT1 [Tetrabaena socialis]|uniref:Protein RFT1 homolog n=1 Tax=Tetrabaena socialis TaxID=47790 RepID=A0A2J8A074_9CHLO|nr:Protein RFT1 [Tetrabaena socialis]|eukprot:PNH05931.1 Protein RFT1 [Tetrabaena socialis]
MVLATMQSAINQGVYGLVSNLGSLVVRTLFQPLEEAAFAAFSAWGAEAQAQAAAAAAAAAAAGPTAGGGGGDGRPAGGGGGARLAPLARALSPMVKAVSVLGLLAAAFGPPYSYTVLRLVYGVRWSETEAPAVLAAYCGYVLLLALNGIGEAFVHAVLDSRGLQQSNALLLLFSAAHLAACVAGVGRAGALGLVGADSVNMLLRIAYSAWCIRRFFRPLSSFSLARDLLPTPSTLAACAAAAAAAALSNRFLLQPPAAPTDGATPQRLFLRRAAMHVAVGAALLVVLLGVVARTERGALREVMAMRRRRRRSGKGAAAAAEAAGGGGGGTKED